MTGDGVRGVMTMLREGRARERGRALPRRDPLTRLPVLMLAPHSRCNCRCLMCDIWRDPAKTEIPVEAVSRWVDDLAGLGLRRVVLTGGEALLHSRIAELLAVLTSRGLRLTLLSTGLLLKRHATAIARHVDEVIVSLDGPPEIHDRVRNLREAYALLAEGVAAVREAGRHVTVGARCTVQRLNCEALCATVDTARALGLDRISFLPVDVDTSAFNRPGGWDADRVASVVVSVEQLPRLEVEIARLEREQAEAFATGFIEESPAKLRRRVLRHFAAVHGRATFAPMVCNAPWVSTVVEADGTVRPCFFHAPVGNVHQNGSLGAILNGPAARAFRASLDTRTNETCRRCVCSVQLREWDADRLGGRGGGR